MKMKQFVIQNAFVPSNDEISVVCPKLRRPSLFNFPVKDLSARTSNGISVAKSSHVIQPPLDNILSEDGDFDVEHSGLVTTSSPSFIRGSRSSRATNPSIQDAQFGDEFFLSPLSPQSWVVVPSTSAAAIVKEGKEKDLSCRRNKNEKKP